MMKKFLPTILLLASLLICTNIVFAEITYSGLLGYYNLGEDIKAEVSITSVDNFNGFFTSSIDCGAFSSNFFTTPFKLTANQVSKVTMPDLEAFNYMKGFCAITWKLVDRDNKVVEEKTSPQFNVTDNLIINIDDAKKSVLPGEDLSIKGKMRNARGEETYGTMEVFLNGDSKKYEIRAGTIDTIVKIPGSIKSGTNSLGLIFYDEKGNKQIIQFDLQIIPLATSIKVEIDNRSYKPYETLSGKITLLDQAGADMDGVLQISLRKLETVNPTNAKKKTENIDAIVLKDSHPGTINLNIDNLYAPGEYLLITSYNTITAQAKFEILEVQKIDYFIDGQQVIVKNTGNIKYKNEETFDASSQKFTKKVVDEVDLRPGESKIIDLSKELKTGDYTLILPNGDKTDSVSVTDKRDLLTKTTDGLSKLTGFASKDIKSSFGSLSIAILIILAVLGIALYAKRALYDKDDEEDGEGEGKEEAKDGEDEDIDVTYMLDGRAATKPVKKKNTVDVFSKKDEHDSDLQEEIMPAKAENKILREKLDQLEKDNASLRGKVQMYERVNKMNSNAAANANSQKPGIGRRY